MTRTDPMYYDLEIQEVKTQEIKAARVGCWWSGEASISGLRSMCDCQLGGYFHAKGHGDNWSQAFDRAQFNYRQSNPCVCKQPSRKFTAVRARLPGGDVGELS